MLVQETVDYELVSRAVGISTSNIDSLALGCFEYCYSHGYSLGAGKSVNGNNAVSVFRLKDKKAVFNTHDRETMYEAIIFATQKVIENKDKDMKK